VPRPDFGQFLRRSLAVLAAEAPDAYREVAEALGDRPLRIVVDGRAHQLRFRNGRHELSNGSDAAGELRTCSSAILALTDGEIDLVEAFVEDKLLLRGPLDVVIQLDLALRIYLAGAVRAASFPLLLSDYRIAVAAAAASSEGAIDGQQD